MANHPIVHIEIPADNMQAATDFYAAVFDWNIQTDETYHYAMFSAEGGPGGGFVGIDEGGDMQYKINSLLVYIGTDDIDATLSKITAQGGKVLQPKTEIPQVGWFARFTDPAGNQMALFTATQQ